jgi:hypothetical protein
MMHGREKSDPVVVAAKPMNKAGQPAAEPVEPRTGTKRNADQQSMLRTLGRARVSQALGRVRQETRQRKKEKVTALLHHVTVDLLREAFLTLKCPLRRQTLKVGAGCGNPARPDLCWGRPAMAVPTANVTQQRL